MLCTTRRPFAVLQFTLFCSRLPLPDKGAALVVADGGAVTAAAPPQPARAVAVPTNMKLRRVFLMSVRMRPPEDWERDASARRGTQSGKPGSQHDVRRVTVYNGVRTSDRPLQDAGAPWRARVRATLPGTTRGHRTRLPRRTFACTATPDMADCLPMPYRILADLVLLLHLAVVVFVVGGLAAVVLGHRQGWSWVRNLPFRLANLAAIGVVAAQAWLGQVCPLTTLES